MRVYRLSNECIYSEEKNNDMINIFMQYFIHPNKDRQKEFIRCLKNNVNNKYIDKIYLLNERIYTDEKLKVKSDKIIQVNINKRLRFCDIFTYINDNKIIGYNILINSDIFFDDTIEMIKYSDIHINKKMFALLRWNYNGNDILNSKIYGPRGDSQDTWIVHSNFNIGKQENKLFNIEFGKPGCDSKIIFVFDLLGYKIVNDPNKIKSYHYHCTNIRNNSTLETIPPPYEKVFPIGYLTEENVDINQNICEITDNFSKYYFINEHDKFKKYIKNKLENNENFLIPRIAGIENNYAIFPKFINDSTMNYLNGNIKIMKNNAGIKMSSIESINKYSDMYLESFVNSDSYFCWAPYDAVYNSIVNSHNIIDQMFNNKNKFYSCVLDIFLYIHHEPWTRLLEGKKILIISAFKESIDLKINDREKIYGIDLFPNCNIITIKPPQTQGSEESKEFDEEFNLFTEKLNNIVNDYDVALVSCGGYGNLVCNYIYKQNKSAIYIGGTLQMYFGIYGNRWLQDSSDIIRLYLNKYWTRPTNYEKPLNYKNIENNCYW